MVVFSVGFFTMYSVHFTPNTVFVFLVFELSQVPLMIGGVSLLCSPHTLRLGFTNFILLPARSKMKLPSMFPDLFPNWSSLTFLSFTLNTLTDVSLVVMDLNSIEPVKDWALNIMGAINPTNANFILNICLILQITKV